MSWSAPPQVSAMAPFGFLAAWAIGSVAAPAQPLDQVNYWFYNIDVDISQPTVNQVVASSYDMVVLDYIPSEVNNTSFPMASLISSLHNAAHPKLVLAYIDIGQAEDYRTYWQAAWSTNPPHSWPEWITGTDPDGWEGNYPVAYWYDEYQEIWLGTDTKDGYLQGIINAGFDGIYLDWIEAYSDESVVTFAQGEGVDPRQEMLWWVEDMANFGRNQKPGFIVIGQNAAELGSRSDYASVVDAISQEQVWFDGAADNDPPGDCPLPATDADVDTPAYYNSLSPPCQSLYNDFPDSTLHVSSQSYIDDLLAANSNGLKIFTVDYAVQSANIITAYQNSRGLGFVPFVSNRALDQYVDLIPRTIAGYEVNAGMTHRSHIETLSVQFSETVNVSGPTALTIHNDTTSTTVDLTGVPLSGNGTSEVTWDLSSTSLADGTSAAADGNYTITLEADQVTELTSGETMLSDYTFQMYRLSGDGNGDRGVGIPDFNLFRQTFGKTSGQVGYNEAFDFNSDSGVGIPDFNYFRDRFGNTLPVPFTGAGSVNLVPEPSSPVLLVMGIMLTAASRKRPTRVSRRTP